MSRGSGLLAIIPARGGSKGLPGKNIRPLAGLPLIAHTILFAKLCPEIDRCIVSTDSKEIADVASRFGAQVPFLRPAELAGDDTPMWPVIRHGLETMEGLDSCRYEEVLLLDPTSPARQPTDVTNALGRLRQCPVADGIVSVSRPTFNPMWVCVVEKDGWMADLMEQGPEIHRRQDAPAVYRINGSLYIWRAPFVRAKKDSWRDKGRHLIYEMPENRTMSIDDADQFQRAELLVNNGLVSFPWLGADVA